MHQLSSIIEVDVNQYRLDCNKNDRLPFCKYTEDIWHVEHAIQEVLLLSGAHSIDSGRGLMSECHEIVAIFSENRGLYCW